MKHNDLPEWAKRAIANAGTNSTVQIQRDFHSLSVAYGTVYFDGMLVSETDEETVQEPLKFEDLPLWARREIIKAGNNSQVQMTSGTDHLQINNDLILFNGKTVIV